MVVVDVVGERSYAIPASSQFVFKTYPSNSQGGIEGLQVKQSVVVLVVLLLALPVVLVVVV